MSKPKIAVFYGTRPEAIKLAPVLALLDRDPRFELLSVSTGQHRDMVAQVRDVFGFPVHVDLDVMTDGQSLASLSAKMLLLIDQVLSETRPDMALVHGDTTTALIAALACFYRRIPVGHVEAGLRSGDLTQPFPEEANRQLISRVATLHFAPTLSSALQLCDERVAGVGGIHQTGNTAIDALRIETNTQGDPAVAAEIKRELAALFPDRLRDRAFVLVTAHRRENLGFGLQSICAAIRQLASDFPDMAFLFPVHPNPQVRVPVQTKLGDVENVGLCPPLSYRLFVALLRTCACVLTDSGGLQEEAPSLGRHVFVMRETTERTEAVAAGMVKLVGTDPAKIRRSIGEFFYGNRSPPFAPKANPYGDGHAAERIVDAIAKNIGSGLHAAAK